MKNPLTIHTDASEQLHYNMDDFPLYSHRDELCRYDYQAVIHWHPDLEFIYIEQGCMDYYINGNIVQLKKGEGIFVNSQRLHYGFSKEHHECTFIALVISPDIFVHISSSASEYMYRKFGLANKDYVHLHPQTDWQNQIIHQMIAVHNDMHSSHFRVLRVISQAISLIDMIGEHLGDYQENTHNSYDQKIFLEMTVYIKNHLDEKLTIDIISKQAGISRNKCCALFQHFTKNTLLNYLVSCRLNKSLEYLKNTHLSISEIAQMCGFSTSSYFTSVFKKNYHLTPKDYRIKLNTSKTEQ